MNPSQPCSPDAIEASAVEWLLEREEGFEPGRAQAFAIWCASDHRHAAAVAQAEMTMALLAELPQVQVPLRARIADHTGIASAESYLHSYRLNSWTAGIAAALALAAVLWWLVPRHSSEELDYVTGTNNPQQVALNDGSVVDVNSNSMIQVRLMRHERHVELNAGEAHFEVAHDSTRPFIVRAGGISVRAVGTAFNVRIGGDGVEVLVIEGRVEISKLPTLLSLGSPAEHSQAGASERVWAPRSGGSSALVIEKVNSQVINETLAWHSQSTHFSNQSLREVIALFNRRNTLQLVLADSELGERMIGGIFAIDQPMAFVRLLEQDGDVIAERHGEREIVLHRTH